MEKDYLKYCRYYKGEDIPDFTEDYKVRFWYMEKRYFFEISDIDKDYWENYSTTTLLESFPKLKNFIMNLDVVTRGLLAYGAIMSYSHDPVTGTDFILKYGT